ncbi:MAG: outer membrane beta-barrel protein [Pseudomonadota bacterium]
MFKSLISLVVLTLFASSAHAQQAYAGAAFGGGTSLKYRTAPGAPTGEDLALFGKLYGGYAFDDTWALEGGFASYGKATFDKAETGAPYDTTLKTNLVYAAVRASYRLNDAWSFNGKLGAARHFQELDQGDTTTRHHEVRPMFGIGAAYNLTTRAALTLELNDYGTVRTPDSKLIVRKLEAGARFSF